MTSIVKHAAEPVLERPGLRTPRSAAFAGIAFAVLITISIVAIRVAIPGNPADAAEWLSDSTRRNAVLAGLALMPFAGVAFLWFVGVLRDRIGAAEDRFFATLFLGSGLLFIAMLFVTAATAAALVESFGGDQNVPTSAAWTISRHACHELMQGGLQMVGVFTVATSTILLRTAVGPRWLALLGYALLSLTVVRMVPVAVAMLRSGARRPTVAFLGWFGPRGLASIVFAVILVEEADLTNESVLLDTTFLTIGLSVLLHGLTAAPLATRYAAWFAAHPLEAAPAFESAPAPEHPPHRWAAARRHAPPDAEDTPAETTP